MSDGRAASNGSPERREQQRQHMQRRWSNPAYRLGQSEKLRRTAASRGKQKQSGAHIAAMHTPEAHAARLAAYAAATTRRYAAQCDRLGGILPPDCRDASRIRDAALTPGIFITSLARYLGVSHTLVQRAIQKGAP